MRIFSANKILNILLWIQNSKYIAKRVLNNQVVLVSNIYKYIF